MKRLHPPSKIINNERGVALLMALVAIMLMTFIAIEVSYDTSVDYVIASQAVNRVKAYYAAKAGLEISLLRISVYKQVVSSLGETLGGNTGMLDPIWTFPFMWPPSASEGMTEVDKSQLDSAVEESYMDAQYVTSIQSEGGRLDVNDLSSGVKALSKSVREQMLKIFTTEVQNNEEFREKYGGFRFDELVNNIMDYVDEDELSLNGGDESQFYSDIEDHEIKMPPNRPFRTPDELLQVAGMKEDFYQLLKPRITVFGTKGINVNYANPEVLKGLDVSMTEEIVNKVIERRNTPDLGGQFKDDSDFLGFIQNLGANSDAIERSKIPLIYEPEFNFRIITTGVASNVKREIIAVAFDFDNLTPRFAEMLDEQDKSPGDKEETPSDDQKDSSDDQKDGSDDAGKKKKKKLKVPKGRPSVVYWEEN